MSAPSGNTSATGGYLVPTSPVPLDDLALDTAIAAIVAGVTGLPGEAVRPRWQDVPSCGDPDVPAAQPRVPDAGQTWVAVGVTAILPDDTPVQVHRGEGEGYTLLRAFRRLDVLASFYGPMSDAYANLARDGLYVAQNREAMRAQGLNLVGFDAIRRVPEIAGMQTRRRSDLPFRLTQVIERRFEIRNVRSLDGRLIASGGSVTGSALILDPLRTTPPDGA